MNHQNPLPLISEGDGQNVPVYSCHVILSRPDNTGRLSGRTANLAGISAEGTSERDVLTSIMKQFKAAVQRYAQSNQSIPFLDPPEAPGPGDVERFIPVHL
ncbi:MAG: hypothetical protein RIK87_20685 [Fuerstiella sp.]